MIGLYLCETIQGEFHPESHPGMVFNGSIAQQISDRIRDDRQDGDGITHVFHKPKDRANKRPYRLVRVSARSLADFDRDSGLVKLVEKEAVTDPLIAAEVLNIKTQVEALGMPYADNPATLKEIDGIWEEVRAIREAEERTKALIYRTDFRIAREPDAENRAALQILRGRLNQTLGEIRLGVVPGEAR